MRTDLFSAGYPFYPGKPEHDIEPQTLPPDRAPAPPELRPEKEMDKTPPPETGPNPNHPLTDPSKR
jgi:hypothetical protein